MAETDQTLLDKDFHFSIDKILQGDTAEFEAVKQPRKHKNGLYDKTLVDPVIADVFGDLRQAYLDNRDLKKQTQDLTNQVQQLQQQFQSVQQQAEVQQASETKLKQLESMTQTLQNDADQRKEAFAKSIQSANEAAKQASAKVKDLQQTIDQQTGELNSNQSLIDDLNHQIEELQQNQTDDTGQQDYQALQASLAQDVNAVLADFRKRLQEIDQQA